MTIFEPRPPWGIPGGGKGGVPPPSNVPRTTSHYYHQNLNRYGQPKMRQRPKSDEHNPPLRHFLSQESSRKIPTPPTKTSGSPREVTFEDKKQISRTLSFGAIIFGMLIGATGGAGVFFGMWWSLNYNFSISAGIAISVGFVAAILLSTSVHARCLSLLLLPQIGTREGRAIILSIISGLIITGPMANIIQNSQEVGKSLSCSYEVSYNQSKILAEVAKDPMNSMNEKIEGSIERAKAFSGIVEKAISAVLKKVEVFSNGLGDLGQGLSMVTERCELEMHNVRNACVSGMDHVYHTCLDKTTYTKTKCNEALSTVINGGTCDVLQGIAQTCMVVDWGQLCTSVDWLDPISKRCREDMGAIRRDCEAAMTAVEKDCRWMVGKAVSGALCKPVDLAKMTCVAFKEADSLCSLATVTQGMCKSLNKAARNLESFGESVNEAFDEVRDYFKVDAVVIGVANTTHNTSKSREQIQAAINTEIEERTQTLRWLTDIAGKLLPLTILFLLISCILYMRKYLKNIEHDNKYITPKFAEIDDTLGASFGKSEKLMPLKPHEKERYQVIRGGCCGLKISWMAIIKAIIPIILHMIFCALICLGDFGLWLILAVAKKHGSVEYNVEGTAKSTYEIKGDGIFATLLKDFVESLSMTKKYEINVSSEYCLPEAVPPNWKLIMICLGLYLLSLFCALLQGYAVRIRGIIAGFFFPDREKERLLHLREKIMRNRVADSIVFGSKSSWSSKGSGGSGIGVKSFQDDRMDYHKIISPQIPPKPKSTNRSLLSSFKIKNKQPKESESMESNKMSRDSSAKTFQTNVSDDYNDGLDSVEEVVHPRGKKFDVIKESENFVQSTDYNFKGKFSKIPERHQIKSNYNLSENDKDTKLLPDPRLKATANQPYNVSRMSSQISKKSSSSGSIDKIPIRVGINPAKKTENRSFFSLDFEMGDEMEWEYEEANDEFDDPSYVIGGSAHQCERLFSKFDDEVIITPTNEEEIKEFTSGFRLSHERDYKMQHCLTRIISIEEEARQMSGNEMRHIQANLTRNLSGQQDKNTEPIAVVRPRVRQLTSLDFNESPKRPNQLLLPFSYNKEISKAKRISRSLSDILQEIEEEEPLDGDSDMEMGSENGDVPMLDAMTRSTSAESLLAMLNGAQKKRDHAAPKDSNNKPHLKGPKAKPYSTEFLRAIQAGRVHMLKPKIIMGN